MKKLFAYTVLTIILVGHSKAQSTLDDYLKIAEQNNPGLKAKKAEFEASMQKIQQASSLPDPSLTVSAYGQMVETRTGQQMARFSLSQMFPWFGTLAAQKDAAALAAQAKYDSYLDARNELYFNVRAAYYPLYEVEKTIQLQKENLKIMETYKTLATTRFQNGKGKLADALRVDIMTNELKTEISILELKRTPLLSSFNQYLNRQLKEDVNIPDSLQLVESGVYNLDSAINNHPKLSELDKKIESMKAQERVAIKQGLPKLGVGFDYIITAKRPNMTFEDNGKDAYMPMVTVSLPIYRKKYKSSVHEARYMQEAFTEMKRETENMLLNEFEKVQFERNKAKAELALYENQITQTGQVINLLLTGLSNSEAGFEEILDLQRMLLKYEINKVSAVKDHSIATARLMYLLSNEL